ncbi:Calcipressin [Amylocystis lapponica]|nr:Calcipressin [Amylocystis lapponica]
MVPSSPALSLSATLTPPHTNTLVITQLPPAFFEPLALDALRNHFELYGPIYAWAPLKGFARIILVYYSEDDAEHAKLSCDCLVVGPTANIAQTILRVYRADPTPIPSASTSTGYNNNFLRPPEIEKNFLISPPGSPPVGWEPIREEPPNATPLADDLIAALRKVQLQAEREQRGAGPEVLLEPEEGVGIGVYVEDCDGGEGGAPMEQDWAYGETSPARAKWKPLPTSRPPGFPIAV